MGTRRAIGVVILVLTFAVPDLLACGDKFLLTGRGTRFQRPPNARAANVLIYAEPASAMAVTIKKEGIESDLKIQAGHRTARADTLQKLSTMVATGHYDVILTAKADSADVQKLFQTSANAPSVLPIDDLVKNRTLLIGIDKEVLKRDQILKDQNLKNQTLKKK